MKNLLKAVLIILSVVLVVKAFLYMIDYLFDTYSEKYVVTPLSDDD